jgi:tetratricopeptide (TPR) repeat protein
MVGRAMQRQALVGYFDGVVRDRAGQCIALEGELGMGKTKLVEWLAAHAGQRLDARVVGGEQLRHAPLPLSTVRQALEDLLRVSPHGSEEHVRSALAAAAAGWARDPQVRLPGGIDLDLLHDFLRPTPESYRKTSQEESVWKDRLFAALARVFVAESLRRPLALVLEEMHWAQALTAQFVEYLMAELMRAPSRLLLVLTYQQSEARDDLPLWETLRWLARLDGHRFHRVRLERLAGAELRTFLQQICRADGALVDYVAYMAGGNPLHTLQLLRYLRNEALLEATPRGWRLKPQVGGLRLVPPGLGDLVDLRVQRFLSRQADRAGYQRVLQRAALLGQRFPVSLLLRLLGEEGDHALRDQLDDLLDGLEAEGLLRSDPADREQLVFDHGLIREVVLRNLAGRRQTRRLHALVARAMEAEYADRLPDHALAIAEHCLAGGEESRAADLFLMAARAAAEGLDHVRALDALQRAEQALSECEASPRARWLPLWEQLGRVSLTLGDRARALASFARLRDEAALCDAPRAQVEAFLGLAAVARLEARWDDAFAALDQAAALCAGTGDGHGLASIHAQRGAIYERHARYQEAVAAYETAAEVFAALADRHRLADCQVALGLLEEWRGDSARAEALLETAIGLSDVAGQMRGWNNLGVVAMQRGLPLRAIECYERALALAERAGYREALAHSLANIGAAQILLARHAEARETLSRAYAIRDEIGDRWGVANALNNLAAVDLGEGDLERAYRLASSAREIYGALAAPRGVATALTNMGSAQRRLGDPERAARHYRDALDAAPTPETRWEALGEAHAGLADILGAAGDRDGARRHGRAAAEIYAALGNETAAARLRAQAAAPA